MGLQIHNPRTGYKPIQLRTKQKKARFQVQTSLSEVHSDLHSISIPGKQ
jgi:hypothetical protein